MKAVLISVQPQWCESIASGKKTIEVRKTRPKIAVPFKCYIYATKSKRDGIGHIVSYSFRSGISFDVGKIIGEFVCNKILDVPSHVGSYEDCQDYEISDDDLEKTCIGLGDLFNYGRGKALYGWHISDLKIYDKPKELSEFNREEECGDAELSYGIVKREQRMKRHFSSIRDIPRECNKCKNLVDMKNDYADEKSGIMLFDYSCKSNFHKPITRPPQSWCYIEEIQKIVKEK